MYRTTVIVWFCTLLSDLVFTGEGKVVFEDTFREGLKNWVVERWEKDKVSVWVEDGKLRVKTQKTINGAMIWCKRELTENFIFEYDLIPLSKSGFFLIFFCVKGVEGEDILSAVSLPNVPRLRSLRNTRRAG